MRRIVLITGVSWSGKTTIQEELLKNGWTRPINCTTRLPRWDYELDEYLFLTKDQYFSKLRNWDFLEHTNYNGNWYAICNSLPEEWNISIILDPVGRAMAMEWFTRKNIPFEMYYIEISKEEQLKRLIARWDTEEQIKERQNDFNWFSWNKFSTILDWEKPTDYLVNIINGKL